MLAVILNNVFLHHKGKIILFNSREEINFFMQKFGEYCMVRKTQEGDPFGGMEAASACSNYGVYEMRASDLETATCGTITYDELIRNK